VGRPKLAATLLPCCCPRFYKQRAPTAQAPRLALPTGSPSRSAALISPFMPAGYVRLSMPGDNSAVQRPSELPDGGGPRTVGQSVGFDFSFGQASWGNSAAERRATVGRRRRLWMTAVCHDSGGVALLLFWHAKPTITRGGSRPDRGHMHRADAWSRCVEVREVRQGKGREVNLK
jgi:hypothetical protein